MKVQYPARPIRTRREHPFPGKPIGLDTAELGVERAPIGKGVHQVPHVRDHLAHRQRRDLSALRPEGGDHFPVTGAGSVRVKKALPAARFHRMVVRGQVFAKAQPEVNDEQGG